jgi:hypothetical protein
MMLAPVSFISNYGVVLSPDAPVLYAQFAPSNQQFSQKPRNKKAPPTTETHRAGDWVCILCHNLNYSFRKVCNRCQVQTKRENLIQSLSMLGKAPSQEETGEEIDHQVCPPGLPKLKERSKPSNTEEPEVFQKTKKSLQLKSSAASLGMFSKPPTTPKITPKKGGADCQSTARQTPSEKWGSSQSTKDGAESSPGLERSIGTYLRGFQLFEGPKSSFKDPTGRPGASIGNPDDDSNPLGQHSEDDQHDLEIWRSIDYVLDDCRE